MTKVLYQAKQPNPKEDYLLPKNVAPLASIVSLTLAVWLYLEIDATAFAAITGVLVIAGCFAIFATSKSGEMACLGVGILFIVGGGFAAFTTPTLLSLLAHLLAVMVIRFRMRTIEAIALSTLVSFMFCIGMVQWNRYYGRMPTREIMALREEFAPVNLRPRLQYEVDTKPSKPTGDKVAVDRIVSDVLDPQLQELQIIVSTEDPYEQLKNSNHFLRMLHSRQAHVFANREGFGVWRMNPIPYRHRVEPPELHNLPFGRLENYMTDEDWDRRPWINNVEGLLWLLGKKGDNQSPSSLAETSDDILAWVHSLGVVDFLQPTGLGVKLGKDQWSGFVSHGFHMNPMEIDSGLNFTLKQLQLVSMLKYDRPQVYQLDHLPRMDQLSDENISTRDLDLFESSALARLQKGADIVTHSHKGKIRMLGALRAGKICLECHSVKPNGLLGAFTYKIDRTDYQPEP